MDDQPSSTETLEEIDIEPEREAYYIDDPKKALKKFFDREGHSLLTYKDPLHHGIPLLNHQVMTSLLTNQVLEE